MIEELTERIELLEEALSGVARILRNRVAYFAKCGRLADVEDVLATFDELAEVITKQTSEGERRYA